MSRDTQSFSNHSFPGASTPEEPVEPEFQIAGIWRILRRYLTLILGLCVVGGALGWIVSKLSSKMYTSTATVEINKLNDTPLGVNTLTGQPQAFNTSDEMTAIMLTEVAELQSASVASEVISRTGLAATPPYSAGSESAGTLDAERQERHQEQMVHIFQSRLKVDIVKDTKLIAVSFTDTDPKRAAVVANAVIETYIQFYTQARTAAAQRASSWLTAHVADLRSQVLESTARISDYEERTGIVGSPDQAGNKDAVPSSDSVVVQRFIDLNKALTTAQAARIAKESIYHITDTRNPDVVLGLNKPATEDAAAGASPVGAQLADLGELAALRQQRSTLLLRVASLMNTFGRKSPEMVQLMEELREADAQIKTEMIRIHKNAESEYLLALADEPGLRKLVAEQQQAVTRLTVGSNELAVLQQDASSKRAIYEDLSAKLEQTTISAGANASNITMVDPALASVSPSSPKTSRNTATGVILGGLLGVFLAFWFDYASNRNVPGVQWQETRPEAVYTAAMLLLIALTGGLAARPVRAQGFPSVPANIDQVPSTTAHSAGLPTFSLSAVPEDFSTAPLQPGYLLQLNVYGVPEMNTTLRVDAGGSVTIPLVGPIKVAGLAAPEAQSKIAAALVSGEILKDPQVTLNVLQYTAGTVSILGEVQSPGRVQLFGPKTLEDVLALAGGETAAAGNTIEVERAGQPPFFVRYAQDSSLQSLRKFVVQSGDSIYVRRAGVIYVLGSVNRPGGYLMVNRGELNVLQAISVASGLTLVAKHGTIYIIRELENGTYKQVDVRFDDMAKGKEPPMPLQLNDILYVPSSLTKTILINGGALIGTAAQAAIFRIP